MDADVSGQILEDRSGSNRLVGSTNAPEQELAPAVHFRAPA